MTDTCDNIIRRPDLVLIVQENRNCYTTNTNHFVINNIGIDDQLSPSGMFEKNLFMVDLRFVFNWSCI